MKQSFRVSLGAVVLALATLAAVIFAILNFDQRSRFESPDDGVAWRDTDRGIEAWKVTPGGPAWQAGIRQGDRLLEIGGQQVPGAVQVTKRVWRAGLWSQLRYKVERGGEPFETPVVIAPAAKPLTAENYLRVVGLIYLFIGIFIFIRRWNAPRAVHFYVFCLVSFILYSFHYSGKLDVFDYEVYWAGVVARLLAPALLLHFALVFPERTQSLLKDFAKLGFVYGPPALLLLVHLNVANNTLGFMPWLGARVLLDRIELGYLAGCFVLAGLVFYHSFRHAPSGVLRQQLKWLAGGTLAGSLPFALFYILPYALNPLLQPWMVFSSLSLVLVPLCFGYAIIRYRLMDVDIIFKRGLAHTAATAAVAAVFFSLVGLSGDIFHTTTNDRLVVVLAITIASFLFQPVREWIQRRLDHFFYRDRLDYRRTRIEFGRTLTNEVRLDPMLTSVMDRISQTLLVDRLAIFVEDETQPGKMKLARSMGVRGYGTLDLSFLDADRREMTRNALFFESPRAVPHARESVQETLEQLDLNYYVPCRIREHCVAVLGLGKTVDGDFLSSDDVELVQTIAGYVAVALDNAQLYSSLEQKALEIARLKDFSENIVESLNVGVLAVDLSGIVESWNTRMEQLFGVPRQDAVGARLDALLPAELATEIAARRDVEQITGIYKQRLQHQGKTLTLNVSITPLVSKSGEHIGRLLLFDDVTQRERMEEQMSQTEKLTSLGLLAAGVAHEVNTPLAVISNYIQMLAKQLPSGDPRHQLIEKVVKQTFRASEIVNNLLNFSRTGTADFAEVDLNTVVDEAPPVLGSTNKLQQVFLNLFLNARDAMPSGGMVEIRTAAQNGSVEVEIT